MFRHTDIDIVLAADIGGSHISSALVDLKHNVILPETLCKQPVDANSTCCTIADQWSDALHRSLHALNGSPCGGVGIAMPGPFDYERGISLITGQNKYESLFGANIRQLLSDRLAEKTTGPVVFENDAACFGLGECRLEEARTHSNVIALTLGTGFGSTFLHHGEILKCGTGVPPGGMLYNFPFHTGVTEDYISSRWIVNAYHAASGQRITEVRDIAHLARSKHDRHAREVFRIFGQNLAEILSPWIRSFNTGMLIVGGSIAKASALFLPALDEILNQQRLKVKIKISEQLESSAILGAAQLIRSQKNIAPRKPDDTTWRLSSQALLPRDADPSTEAAAYRLYPARPLASGTIMRGFDTLAHWIAGRKLVLIDGYVGIDWDIVRSELAKHLTANNIRTVWFETSAFLKQSAVLERMVQPFLGAEDDVWGRITSLRLSDFFQSEKQSVFQPAAGYDVTVVIGTGAALFHDDAEVVYFDLPKNEIQYRSRAGSITNLGCGQPSSPTSMYKRFYFVDWVVLNTHRNSIKDRIVIVADGQWKTEVNWAFATDINATLVMAACNVIRARPWFEAGAWGGQWLKEHIPGINKNEINYAWSFELIVPENGILLQSDGALMEISFDWLMEHAGPAILGKDHSRFGNAFPIRFDFLDTYNGGNLSVQCHPTPEYIRRIFGERITQDETYYILDCTPDATVYLGFQQDIDAVQFRNEVERSMRTNQPVAITDYVQKLSARKHDLFLIPNGTIHSAGAGNLVLEISATPYIFTFKIYDWLRPDLNGRPRPINIEHAFNNLNFARLGPQVHQELIAKPSVLEKGEDFEIVHLPTHREHFYDLHRLEFSGRIQLETKNTCHILMLVEGRSVQLKTNSGETHVFYFAETIVIPAAATSYELNSPNGEKIKMVKAFIK